MATMCVRCGAKKSLLDSFLADVPGEGYVCVDCREKAELARAQIDKDCREQERRQEADRIAKIEQAAPKVLVTTTQSIDGTRAVAYLGIESVEYVIGTGIFSEVGGDIADMFGARSTAFEMKLQVAKRHAMEVLKYRAAEKGANAVIGIDMDFTEFSGNRVALILNGTLVKLVAVGAKGTAPLP